MGNVTSKVRALNARKMLLSEVEYIEGVINSANGLHYYPSMTELCLRHGLSTSTMGRVMKAGMWRKRRDENKDRIARGDIVQNAQAVVDNRFGAYSRGAECVDLLGLLALSRVRYLLSQDISECSSKELNELQSVIERNIKTANLIFQKAGDIIGDNLSGGGKKGVSNGRLADDGSGGESGLGSAGSVIEVDQVGQVFADTARESSEGEV